MGVSYNQKVIITISTVELVDGMKVLQKKNRFPSRKSLNVMRVENRVFLLGRVILRVMSLQHGGADQHDLLVAGDVVSF
jgi:hypothetical protein